MLLLVLCALSGHRGPPWPRWFLRNRTCCSLILKHGGEVSQPCCGCILCVVLGFSSVKFPLARPFKECLPSNADGSRRANGGTTTRTQARGKKPIGVWPLKPHRNCHCPPERNRSLVEAGVSKNTWQQASQCGACHVQTDIVKARRNLESSTGSEGLTTGKKGCVESTMRKTVTIRDVAWNKTGIPGDSREDRAQERDLPCQGGKSSESMDVVCNTQGTIGNQHKPFESNEGMVRGEEEVRCCRKGLLKSSDAARRNGQGSGGVFKISQGNNDRKANEREYAVEIQENTSRCHAAQLDLDWGQEATHHRTVRSDERV